MTLTLFVSMLSTDPATYVMWVVMVMFSICVHEYAHAWVALKEGDPTAANHGHLTLDPMVQMGMYSIVMLLVVGISWGAVPVNPHRMRRRYSHAIVSFAGPAANLILFVAFCFLLAVLARTGIETYDEMLTLGAVLNIFLFIFNMLPIPMLDGWTVFAYLFPKLERVSNDVKNGVTAFLFLLFFMTPLLGIFYGIGEIAARIVTGLFMSLLMV